MRLRDPKLFAALYAFPAVLLAIACASSTHAPEYTPSGQPTALGLLGDGQPALRTVVADINGSAVTVEVADESDERTNGLSRRDGLADNAGMLFVWDEEGSHTLWMREMRFGLDFIWLDAGKRVVHVDRDVQPQPGVDDSKLVRYTPETPVRYAIELVAGEASRLGVAVGDVVPFGEGSD